MDARDVYNLYEAYRSVYEDREYLNEDVDYELDEGKSQASMTPLQKIRIRNKEYFRNSPETEQKTTQRRAERSSERGVKTVKGEKSAFGTMRHVGGPYKEEVDLYDVVLDHLLDEGYCDDVQSAEIIMANMSEEWLAGILDEAKEEEGKSDFEKKDIRGRRFVSKTQGKEGVENYDKSPVESRGSWVGAARRRAHNSQRKHG